MYCPFGEKETASNGNFFVGSSIMVCPIPISHSRIVPSKEAEAMTLSSGLSDMEVTLSVCPLNMEVLLCDALLKAISASIS